MVGFTQSLLICFAEALVSQVSESHEPTKKLEKLEPIKKDEGSTKEEAKAIAESKIALKSHMS